MLLAVVRGHATAGGSPHLYRLSLGIAKIKRNPFLILPDAEDVAARFSLHTSQECGVVRVAP